MSNVQDKPASPTVAEWARQATTYLIESGFNAAEAGQEVSVLGRHVLGWDSAAWIVRDTHQIDLETFGALRAALARRAAREPVAYITGSREFYGRDFQVTPAVLIPRPETELLVHTAGSLLKDIVQRGERRPQVLDVGTGSGCIAICLALECPLIGITATDTSATALEVARDNATRHHVLDRVTFLEAHLTAGLEARFDVVVSNPPYVASSDRDALAPDVRDFEPAPALFGGRDGFAVIDELIPAARRALVPSGWLVMEIGAGQRDAVVERLWRHGFKRIGVARDLAGHPRVVSAQAPEPSV